MSSGIRAEVKIDSPAACPVARFSARADATTNSVDKSVNPDDPTSVTEEFMIEASAEAFEDEEPEPTEVFSYDEKSVFRFDRELGSGCPCECVERFDCPVVDVRAREGALYLTFHAAEMAGLQAVIGELRERFSSLDVLRLLQSEGSHGGENLVFVDRGQLTDRQHEVLETAHEMGYFDHPKGANAGEVAATLDITASTFTEHVAAAQRKLLGSILDT